MKKSFLFTVTLIFTVIGVSHAQNPVVDRYPAAEIYVIDPQTGQEVLAQSDDAVLFKDAFIDLVKNTNRVRAMRGNNHNIPIVITQSDPADGNAFQLVQQGKFLGQMITKYTFSYSVDQNTLYYLDPVSQTWQPELVQGYNVVNMNNCLALGKFNELQPAYADNNNDGDVQQSVDDGSDEDITADTPPPALQDYDQPECPQDGYLWQPGYWAFNPGGGYYWVPGVWVAPPNEGLLWTPPYWGFVGGVYIFHAGYWGPHVGFYGGINYGYGYAGDGYYGGGWYGGHFRYNTAVVRVNTVYVHNVYVDRTVVHVGTRVNNVSFNGGPGGTTNRPTQRELTVNNETHIRDFHQDPKAANGVNTYHNNNGGFNQGNNGGRNGNANYPRNNNSAAGNNTNTNGNSTAGSNGGRNGNVYVPRNGSAPANNYGGRNGNMFTPHNGSTTNSNSPNTYTPRNGNAPSTPTNVPSGQRANGNAQGTPRTPGNGPAVPRGPGGHNYNGNGGNNSPRSGGQNRNNGNGGGDRSKKGNQ